MFGRINELTEEVNVLVGKPTYVIMVIANEPLILSGTLVRILQHKVIYSSLEVDGHAPILQTSKQRLSKTELPEGGLPPCKCWSRDLNQDFLVSEAILLSTVVHPVCVTEEGTNSKMTLMTCAEIICTFVWLREGC